jgi:ABC-type nitrate/sulfonate/bicarbonate transport system substrate-binding protein
MIAFHSDFVSKRPDGVRAILFSFSEVQKYYEDHKKESLNIMSNLTGVSVEEIAQGLNQSRVLDLYDNYYYPMENSNQSNSLNNSGKYIGNFFLDRSQIRDYPDLNKIIDPKFVRAL